MHRLSGFRALCRMTEYFRVENAAETSAIVQKPISSSTPELRNDPNLSTHMPELRKTLSLNTPFPLNPNPQNRLCLHIRRHFCMRRLTPGRGLCWPFCHRISEVPLTSMQMKVPYLPIAEKLCSIGLRNRNHIIEDSMTCQRTRLAF